jgi:hypothetical protein
MSNNGRATIPEVVAFFEENGRKLPKVELGKLKKDSDGAEIPDYEQIAAGIGDGSLTYE